LKFTTQRNAMHSSLRKNFGTNSIETRTLTNNMSIIRTGEVLRAKGSFTQTTILWDENLSKRVSKKS